MSDIVPELIEVGKELRAMYKDIADKKQAAIEKYWIYSGKRVRLISTGEIYWARVYDMFQPQMIHCIVRYDLCKNEKMQRKAMNVTASEIELVEEKVDALSKV